MLSRVVSILAAVCIGFGVLLAPKLESAVPTPTPTPNVAPQVMATPRASVPESKPIDLQPTVDVNAAKVQELTRLLQSNNAEIARLREQLQTLQTQLTAKNQQLEQALQTNNTALTNLVLQLKNAQESLDAHAAKIAHLQQELQIAQEKNVQLDQALKTNITELTQALQQLKSNQSQIAATLDRLVRASEINGIEIANLVDRQESTHTQIQIAGMIGVGVGAVLVSAVIGLALMVKQLRTSSKKIDSGAQQGRMNVRLESELKALRAEMGDLRQQIGGLRFQVTEASVVAKSNGGNGASLLKRIPAPQSTAGS